MISSVNSTISALQAFRTKMDVTADNVANVNTEGFKKSKADIEEGAHGDVRVEINRVDTPGHRYQELKSEQVAEKESSNVNLEEEIPSMIVTQNAYEANLKTLQTQDTMLGSLLDIIG
jgi:flagellar hook protein FlgE